MTPEDRLGSVATQSSDFRLEKLADLAYHVLSYHSIFQAVTDDGHSAPMCYCLSDVFSRWSQKIPLSEICILDFNLKLKIFLINNLWYAMAISFLPEHLETDPWDYAAAQF